MNKLFDKVTVKELLPIFTIKENIEANSIELLKCVEHEFDIVVGKGLYKIGEVLNYILPDTNLKEGNEYLDDYIYPKNKEGVIVSSKLGSKNRVKAIGFNFHTGDFKKLYSNGIVCPVKIDISDFVYKYEEPDNVQKHNGGSEFSRKFPEGFYKTDETNYKLISNSLVFPIELVGTKKIDGSSITLYSKFNGESGICSRNLEKPLIMKIKTGVDYHWVGKLMKFFKLKPFSWTTKTVFTETESTSEFVVYGKPLLDKLKTAIHWIDNDLNIKREGYVLRG